MNCEIRLPGLILSGENSAERLPALLPAAGPLLIVSARSHAEWARRTLLQEECRGLLLTGFQPELPLTDADRVLQEGRRIGAQAVVAVGGGSVMDLGKTVAALLPLEGMTADYFYNRRTIPGKGVFFAALPTTAGTGAEMTANAVLRDPETGIKQSLRHPGMMADVAVSDPCLTWGCPPALTAASGFDALTQAVESVLSNRATACTRALAGEALQLLLAALPGAMRDEHPARAAAAEGSMMTGMAFAQSGLGAVHGLAHPLGSLLHVPHGVCCAILLPEILRHNRDCLGLLPGGEHPETFIARVEKLRQDLDLPATFRAFGLNASHYPFVLRHCRSSSMKCNPIPLADEEIVRILETLT